MKPGLILILGLCWCFNHYSKVNSKKCMDASYEKGNDQSITRKYQGEWGIFGYINRKIYGSHDDFYDLTGDDKKLLCACAIKKRNENVDYNAIYNQMNYKSIEVSIDIDWFCFKKYPHPTPAIKCFSGTEKAVVLKSFTKKSYSNPQWDIYVANVVNDQVGDFQGIIKNVDLFSSKPKN